MSPQLKGRAVAPVLQIIWDPNMTAWYDSFLQGSPNSRGLRGADTFVIALYADTI